MNVDDLSRRIVVRHREAGYLRLELPTEICYPAAAAAVERGLREVTGVYRVTVSPAERRLVVRHDAHVCTAADVARGLKALLGDLPAAPGTVVAALDATLHDAGAKARRAFAGLRAGLERLRHPDAPAGSLQARLQPVLANALTEKAIINFLNDLVAFYLIRVHWELISQRWLKDPVKYGNAWLTTFYLVFLLVRYRKSIAKPAAQTAPQAETRP
ncbi:MAG: heavy metal-associated domain-containing protein [Sulfurisoma sp.]|nr:heavy metal-associated domain-containing protein [Sulfurisoma sp.]